MLSTQKNGNERSTVVNLIPYPTTTQGFMIVHEYKQPVIFRFLPNPNFRGKLVSVEWNIQDNVKHTITSDDEVFSLFEQVGERPEIRVSSSFFDTLDLPATANLRIKFHFDTFRAESSWYGFLYIKRTYGDMEEESKVPYKKSTTDSEI